MGQPVRTRRTATTNAATAVDVTGDKVMPEQIMHLRHIALANNSGESVTLLFGILTGADFVQILAKQTVATGDAYGTEIDLLLLEGDQLSARVTGAADKGLVELFVSGKLLDWSEYVGTPAPGQ